MFVDAVEKGF
jgi:hypothetical protein